MEAFKAGRLDPRHKEPPVVAAVHVDAGKVHLRADDGAPGVRDPRWADAKVACCVTYPTREGDADPEPEPPVAFLDPPKVARLRHEFAKVRSLPATPAPAPLGPAAATSAWPSQPGRAWNLYEKLLRSAWGGRVGEVLTEIDRHRDRLGPAAKDAPDDDPRLRLERVAEYVRANAGRMDYPRCRRQGLPVTSTLVESPIKQFNQRVRGTEKFWIGGGAEALLRVRAAYLSEDDRADELFACRRPPRAAGRARLGAAA